MNRSAEVVLACKDLDRTVAFFTELGFQIELVFPADDPSVTVMSGHGARIRLERIFVAPNGTSIDFVARDTRLALPPVAPAFVLAKSGEAGSWKRGRAGMHYRDLVPGRQGGRVIASLIRIPDGGSVADYVHFHEIEFQMVYCRAGWARVVYENQGPPFMMHAGDCVLQPPRIRHRVLECSSGLEVIELSTPAEHETRADHDLALPTAAVSPERDFSGQRFVRHVAALAEWRPSRRAGFAVRDLGLAAATRGLADARVSRRVSDAPSSSWAHDAEVRLIYVLAGSATLRCGGRESARLDEGDSLIVPPGVEHWLDECASDLEVLEVELRLARP